MARPLIEVFSVEIFPESLNIEVYGDIFIYDKDNLKQTSALYGRGFEHPEVISKKGQLLLLTGSDVPLSMPNPVLTVHLMDRNKASSDKPFTVSCTLPLDNSIQDYYDQDKSCVIEGEYGYVRVNYIAMKFGVVAQLSLILYRHNPSVVEKLKELEASNKGFPVYGTIVAHYGKTYGRTACDPCVRFFNLLNIPQDESIPLYFRTQYNDACLQLARGLVAVPAYSSLIIEVDLKETYTNKQFLCGKVNDRASRGCDYLYENRPTRIYSKNAWLYVHYLNPSIDFVSQCSLLIEDKLASMSLDRKEYLPGWFDRESLLEVHSVLIGRENGVDVSVSGLIDIRHSNWAEIVCIFKRDDKNADKLVNGKELLSVTGPSSPAEFMMADEYFTIMIELNDANNHLNIPGGQINLNTYIFKKDIYKYDKPLCTVIEGVRGFCAVHYTIFSTAVGVELKCVLLCKSVDVGIVYGKVVASYDMFDYALFECDKKYYCRVLFDKSETDHWVPCKKAVPKLAQESLTDSYKPTETELFRSYVAMPVGYTLNLHVELDASSHPGRRGSVEHFEDILQFQIGGESSMKITGQDFEILAYMKIIPSSSWRL